MAIAGAFIGTFYRYGKDKWEGTEYAWEGSFAIIATPIITVVGAGLLRVNKMQDKWRAKLIDSVGDGPGKKGLLAWIKRRWEKYFLFALPFITVLREGLEAVIFIAGVSFSAPAYAVPLPVFMGLVAGGVVGYVIYK